MGLIDEVDSMHILRGALDSAGVGHPSPVVVVGSGLQKWLSPEKIPPEIDLQKQPLQKWLLQEMAVRCNWPFRFRPPSNFVHMKYIQLKLFNFIYGLFRSNQVLKLRGFDP